MRHHNSCPYSYLSEGRTKSVDHPCLADEWTFAKPNASHKYIKVLQCILDNPNLTRAEVHEKVFRTKYTSGNRSSMWSVLLWRDFIDYNKDFKYAITPKGMELLKTACINELASRFNTTKESISKILS